MHLVRTGPYWPDLVLGCMESGDKNIGGGREGAAVVLTGVTISDGPCDREEVSGG